LMGGDDHPVGLDIPRLHPTDGLGDGGGIRGRRCGHIASEWTE